MCDGEKVESALVPYFGDNLPEKSKEKALECLKKGGKLYLLHIVDEGTTRSIRYMTSQLGEESQLIQNFKEAKKKLQESSARDFIEETKKEAAKRGVSIESIHVEGEPTEEVLKAVEKHSIQLIVVEQMREKIVEIFLGDEINFLKENVPCKVITVS